MTKVQRVISTSALAVFAVACADPAGLDRTLVPASGPSLDASVNPTAVNDLLPGDLAFPGRVRVCKSTPTGDPALAWTYTIQVATLLGTAAPAAITWDGSITGVSGQTVCETAYTSAKEGGGLDRVIITEQALPANWALDHLDVVRMKHGSGAYTPPAGTPIDVASLATRQATIYVNGDMLRDVTFTNNFTQTTTGCTYTKGWYRNNGSATVIAVDGRTVAQAQAIFNATPGKPGLVTWQGDNNTLNLYQQLLAALNNLGGNATAGPPAVDAAIAAALAATGGTGVNITLVAGTDVGGLTEALASFNEGDFAGWPHCAD